MSWRAVVGPIAAMSVLVLSSGSLAAQQIAAERIPYSEFALRPRGQPIIPLFDGWYENPDRTKSMCLGYKNLNLEEAFDIPIGPDNFLEPSEFNGLQPTHFTPAPESLDRSRKGARYRRQYCVVTIRAPEDFGERQVVWTLRVHGQTLSNPASLLSAYVIDEPQSDRGGLAPVIRIGQDGNETQGRNGPFVGPYHARRGEPLPLTVSVESSEGPIWVGWFHHQGAGVVTFSESELEVEGGGGSGTTTATFSQPGEYLLLVQAISDPSEFEFMCCWTNAYVRVIAE